MTAQELKNSILQHAVQGKLVPQDPTDEPASVLLERIKAEKAQLIKDKKIKAEKPLAPITDEEIPFEIPENWEWVRFDSINQLITCGHAATPKYVEKGRAFLSAKNIKPFRFLPDIHNFISEELYQSLTKTTNPTRGDILLTRVGAGIGEAAIIDQDLEFAIYVSLTLIKPFQNLVSNKYILYWLASPLGIQSSLNNIWGKNASQGNLNVNKVREFLFPLPPLSEQQRIVAKIEELMPLVEEYDKAEKELTELNAKFPEQIKKSVLQYAIQGKLVPQSGGDEPASELLKRIKAEKEKSFPLRGNKKGASLPPITDEEIPFEIPESWVWVKLGEIGTYRKGPFGSSLTKSMFVPKSDESIKVYEQKNAIYKNHLLGDYYIKKEYFETKMKGFEIYPGDILVSCAGTIGETYIFPANAERGIINQALMIMKISKEINVEYFLLYFDYMLKKTAQFASNGSAIKNIPPFEVFKNLLFPLPPLSEQQRIVAKVEEVLGVCEGLKA